MKKIIAIIIAIFILVGGGFFYLPSYLSVSSNEEIVEVTVPKGASLNYVANLLYEEGVIKNKLWFKYKSKSESVDRNIKPGTYTFEPNMSLEDIFALLQKGETEAPIIVTIPEGFTLYQIAARMEAAGLATKEEFIEATKIFFQEKGYDFDTSDLYYEMEGYLYPDTYYFSQKQSPQEIVATLVKTMEDVFTEEYKARAEELNMSIHQVLTMASLIEREAYNEEEKVIISGVIHNRIEKKMPLQIDATVIYGIGKGEKHINRVLWSHLKDSSPFNTYQNPGLPPGPIAAPSKTAILAALYPEDHDYYYYVLGENGHVFSRTLSEHEINAAKYYETLN